LIFISTRVVYLKILAVTNLTSRFQTTVPSEVRDKLQLTETDRVVWVLDGDKITLQKA
jgi:AbrB family looped-hinge helix DNA binding protein